MDVKITPKVMPTESRLPDSTIALDLVPVKSFLGVETTQPKDVEEMTYIRNLFGRGVTETDMLYELRQVERKLGVPRLGETRLGKLYNYFRAMQNVKQAEKIRDALLI